MRRRAVLFINTMAAAVVVAGGVALAANINCEAGVPCLGTNKADTMTGTNQADNMKGRGGGDTMYGRGGDDDLAGGDGVDEIYAGSGNDKLDSGPNPSTVTPEKLSGGDGDDSYVFEDGWGNDKIIDGESSGVDTLVFSTGVKRLNVDLGRGEVYAAGGTLYFPATVVIEDVEGGGNRDVIRGNDSDNTLNGHDVNDSLYGRGGNDVLIGGHGADTFNGGPGDDTLEGGDITDVIDGNDLYIFEDGWGNDTITDAAGTDHLFFGGLTSSVTVDLAAGTATDGTNTVTWAPQVIENVIENATGGTADDVLYGDGSGNTLNGQGGNDTIYGRDGNDTIYGGPGVDTVYGDHPNFPAETGDDIIDVEGGNIIGDTGIIGDTVDCGPGSNDVVFYDVGTDTIANCEVLNPPRLP